MRTLFAILLLAAASAAAEQTLIERGEYLVNASGCVHCHTDTENKGPELAGGRKLETPFGIFYTPNITPDEETGIAGWTEGQFLMAMWRGSSPDDEHYYPAFPYPSYSGMSEEDVFAIRAYLLNREPVRRQTPDHELPWYLSYRWTLGIWKSLYVRYERFQPEEERSERWNRGAYLVRHLGHCAECHSDRGLLGNVVKNPELAGTKGGPHGKPMPNITPDREDGIGAWSRDELLFFLELGMKPDGDFVGSSMVPVIDGGTALLTPEDREAIAEYLMSLPAWPGEAP